MPTARRQNNEIPFNKQLVLFKYFLDLLGVKDITFVSEHLNSEEYEGYCENGHTYFCEYLVKVSRLYDGRIPDWQIRNYDDNICRYTRSIAEKRGNFKWKYFQYLSLLFTEIYLDRFFNDRDAFCSELNEYLEKINNENGGLLGFEPYTPESLNKLAFMSATGSGKTLVMHVNILQYLHYFKLAKRLNSRLEIQRPKKKAKYES